MTIRALIVVHEPVACDRLVALLAVEPGAELAGTAATGRDAVDQIHRLAPDLVLLDPQRPEPDGFGVIEAVGADRMPATVFVTDRDEHAVRAFDVNAIDYLLEPFGRHRFQQALRRVSRHLARERSVELTGRIAALLDELNGAAQPDADRLLVRTNGRVAFVDVARIDWVEAQGNYVRVHAAGESYLLRKTMAALLGRLGDHRFLRVHRSRLVNVARVRELRLTRETGYEVVLTDGRRLGLGRMYKDALLARVSCGLTDEAGRALDRPGAPQPAEPHLTGPARSIS